MPYRNLTIEQMSRYLGLGVAETEKLARKGELPGEKVCGNWRCNRIQMVEWLQQRMHTLDEARLRMIESAMGEIVVDENPENEARHMVVTEIMSLRGVCLDLPAKTKTSLLKELVNLADGTGLLFDKDGLLAAIEQREELCSTAIHAGLAVPHPRRCMPYATAEPLVCLGRVNGGIGFYAPDGELTRLFFLICCHEESHHLHVLARLMRILDEDTIAKLMKIESPEMALELLIEREASLAGS